MTSPDGINWTSRTAAADNQWYSVTYSNSLFVAVSITGTNRVMTSPDGINWTSRTAAAANQWQSVTYRNGLFVAVAQTGTGNRVMTSGFQEISSYEPNNIEQGNRTFTGQNITYSNYPSTRNDTENPDNLYFSRNANGDQGVKQLEDIFAIYNAQASSDLELVSTADSTTAYPLFSNVTKTNTDFYENQGDTVIFFKQPGVYRIDAGLIFETSGSTQSVNTILKFEPSVSYGRSFSIDANGDRTSHAYNAVVTISTAYTKLRISKQTGAIATTTFFGSDSRITIQRVY